MSADPYASRAYDDAFEPLCTAPDELPATKPSGLFAAAADIARSAAPSLPLEVIRDEYRALGKDS